MSTRDPRAAALAAELAAIYAYGVLGFRLAPGEQPVARTAEEAHRLRRDYLVQKVSGVPTPAGYQLPFPVTDRATALTLAICIEDGVAQAWRPVLPATQGTDRRTALAAMTDAAVRATRWRRLAGVGPATLTYPGQP